MKLRLNSVLVPLFSLTLIACGYPPEFQEFRGLSKEQAHDKFKQLPIDKQVDFHLYKMTNHLIAVLPKILDCEENLYFHI